MGDKRRFDLFASFIQEKLPRGARIADVAAGKGTLAFELRRRGFHVVPFEPHPRRGGQVRRLNMQVRTFSADLADGFDAVVGMHPDEATDVILDAASRRHGVLAIVCPCCPKPTAWAYWGPKLSRTSWNEHLVQESARRGLRLEATRLRMNGSNLVLRGRA